MPFASGVEECRRVAKALANIRPPGGVFLRAVQAGLCLFRRPAELTSGMRRELASQQSIVGPPAVIPQTHPRKVKQLVNEDARHFLRIRAQRRLQHHLAAAYKRPGMYRPAACGIGQKFSARGRERAAKAHANGTPLNAVESRRQRFNERLEAPFDSERNLDSPPLA